MTQKFVSPLNPPLAPRIGHTLRVLVMTRISTDHQNKLSLDDQAELCKNRVKQHYDGPLHFDTIKHRESGERRERKDLTEARKKIEDGDVDLVVAEDLARIMRHVTEALEFLDFCQDHDTRFLAINDQIDTASGNKVLSIISSMRHEMYNADTSNRIKRSEDKTHTLIVLSAALAPSAKSIYLPGTTRKTQGTQTQACERGWLGDVGL